MSVHDWTRVDAGTFHAFHTAWITHLSEALNEGLLPPGYYALPEQHGGRLIADVLTLQVPPPGAVPRLIAEGGVAVAETPPQVRGAAPSPAARWRGRTWRSVTSAATNCRHVRDRFARQQRPGGPRSRSFADKVETALWHAIHVLVVDIFPPGPNDPQGMHGRSWNAFR